MEEGLEGAVRLPGSERLGPDGRKLPNSILLYNRNRSRFLKVIPLYMKTRYDYILAGGGCAALSLAWHMTNREALKNKEILIIDRELKTENDRTWCFWEKENGPFEPIVHHRWSQAWFHSDGFSKLLDLTPYTYKMIRADRFYAHVKESLSRYPNVHWLKADVLDCTSGEGMAEVQTNLGDFEADWVFTSIPPKTVRKPGYYYLLQHFKGWMVKTKLPVFDPMQPTLMDFRVDQQADCRFMYILPVSPYEALVEFTLFSKSLLREEEYDEALAHYLKAELHIGEYEITHSEFGVIPMYSEKFESPTGGRLVPIGTAGNQTKASTGYTFTRIQEHAARICDGLQENNVEALYRQRPSARFHLYDRILLHVLAEGIVPGATVFKQLFRRNSPEAVFGFLDEQTTLLEEFRLLNTVPVLKFILPAWKELWKLGKSGG